MAFLYFILSLISGLIYYLKLPNWDIMSNEIHEIKDIYN